MPSASISPAVDLSRTFTAQITQARYGSSTTAGVVTYETILKVANPDLALRPGMTATADITVRELKDAFLVSGAALRFTPPVVQAEEKTSRGLFFSLFPRPPREQRPSDDGSLGKGKQRVWVLKDGRPTPVVITTGWTSGSLTEVTSGELAAGAPLIVDILSEAK